MTFDTEIGAARARMTAGELDAAMLHLERAHVIGQLQVWPHVLSHWLMLKVELRRGRPLAAFGQFVRIVLGAVGSAVGVVPTGNTGGSDISMFQRLPVAPDLQAAIETQPRNVFAKSAPLAWMMVTLLAVTMVWPTDSGSVSRLLAPATHLQTGVVWSLIVGAGILAALLSSPALVPARRIILCKLLSIVLALACLVFVTPAIAFAWGVLVAMIYREAGSKR
jgi:hypothetical protein